MNQTARVLSTGGKVSKDKRDGFWYWMSLMNPSFMLMGLFGGIGKEAQEKSEAASEDMTAGVLVLLVIAVIAVAILGVFYLAFKILG